MISAKSLNELHFSKNFFVSLKLILKLSSTKLIHDFNFDLSTLFYSRFIVYFTAIHKCKNIDNKQYNSSTIYTIITVYIFHNKISVNKISEKFKHSPQN